MYKSLSIIKLYINNITYSYFMIVVTIAKTIEYCHLMDTCFTTQVHIY